MTIDSTLHLAHLLLLGLWGGLVAAETVVELSARDPETRRHAARLHYWMDVIIELPLLLGISATGGWLAARMWPLGTLHWIKVGCATAAIATNAWCALQVFRRRAARHDERVVLRLTQRIRSSWVGVPFGAAAMTIGLGFFHR